MSDYGHDLQFGVFLAPAADRAGSVLRQAERADELGLDLVSLQDHPYQSAFLETWTYLSVIAARTSRVKVFPNVANVPLRPPAMLARSAASLDILSGGRVELGLGSGAFPDGVAAMGGPRRTTGEAIEALEEAIAVIRALWTPGRGVRFEGEHYQLAGAHPGPFPTHPIGIWVGAYKKRMLDLTGRLADGWLPSSPYAPPEQLPEMNKLVDEGAEKAGRDPAEIRRLYNIVGSFNGTGDTFLQGPPDVWVEQLAELAVTDGISGFVLMVDANDGGSLDVFAQEVAPAVRELVARERGVPSTVESVVPRPSIQLWDESERPTGPGDYPETGSGTGQHLVEVHDHLRQELTQIRDVVRQVADGALDIGGARSLINTMTMRQNNWTLGAYCESYCRVVTMHHTAEDRSLFPQLRRADPRLVPVVDRLEQEHHMIAEVLERLDAALVALVAEPGAITELQTTMDVLTDNLLSHLSYEERELVGPLSQLPLRV